MFVFFIRYLFPARRRAELSRRTHKCVTVRIIRTAGRYSEVSSHRETRVPSLE